MKAAAQAVFLVAAGNSLVSVIFFTGAFNIQPSLAAGLYALVLAAILLALGPFVWRGSKVVVSFALAIYVADAALWLYDLNATGRAANRWRHLPRRNACLQGNGLVGPP
jgi:hypothetical protein